MKLTAKEAVEETKKMWQWISENPEKKKEDYLKLFKKNVDLLNCCYLCEFCKKKGIIKYPLDCRRCPLINLWSNDLSLALSYDYKCIRSYDSPYFKYTYFIAKHFKQESAVCASEIVKLCDKWLYLNS